MRMQNKGTLYTPGENFKRCNHFGKQQNSWACSLKKKKNNEICNSYMAQEPSNCIHIAWNWKQPRCPSASDWLSP